MTNQATPTWAVPGAKVVCVDDAWNKGGPTRLPMLREVLTIKEVLTRDDYAAVGVSYVIPPVVLSFHELGHDWTFNAGNFKPLAEPKSEAHDVALFEDIVRGMSLVERLDRIAETLDA